MRVKVSTIILAAFAGIAAFAANAQLGFPMQLPKDDFTWVWGRAMRPGADARRGFEDFSIVGSDTGFRCELTGKISLASGIGRMETRDLEQQLRTSLSFIQDSAYTMNRFESYRYIDWAVLDCKKPEADDTESELAEREAKALERAERRRERRRAREE